MPLDAAADPAKLAVRIQANQAVFQHADGLSGQTPKAVRGGIRSIRLYRDNNDPNPVELFDYGSNPVEVGYNNGDVTLLAQIEPSKIPAGTYTQIRMVQTHSRFRVDGAYHDAGKDMTGVFDDVLVMTDGTMLDGTMRNAGYFRYVFESSQGDKQEFTGDNGMIAPYSTTAGAVAVVEQGQWAVYFPVQVTVPAQLPSGSALNINVNMFESFRWKDMSGPGFQDGVFDATSISYELVERFGGNEFSTVLQ